MRALTRLRRNRRELLEDEVVAAWPDEGTRAEAGLQHQRQIEAGHYARKQLLSPIRLISWSHRQRYKLGVRLASRFAGERVLDYGCGDGTFLALLVDSPNPPELAVGVEMDSSLVEDCTKRLGSDARLRFVVASELHSLEHEGAYSGVVCMEVFEHAVEPGKLITDLYRVLASNGTLVVSVPVEIGPALLIKQAVRRVAGWFRVGDYPGTTPYRWNELWKSVLAGEQQHIARPIHGPPSFGFTIIKDSIGRQWHGRSRSSSRLKP